MREVLPRVWHWAAEHPRIHTAVSSYWLEETAVLIDPLVPPDVGLSWFAARSAPPRAILLSNRHHYRESARFVERFGCTVHCNRVGLHEFAHEQVVEGFEIGERLPGDVLACEVGAICPDDTALYLPQKRALVFADGVVRSGPQDRDGPLGFVPDGLMDEPEQTKQGLLAACVHLLDELDFEHLLLAHGGPVIGDGRERLRELVRDGGRTAFEFS
ncbi:MAG TPA: hypothetical protein VGL37_00375 [Solirubrobacteraceae bacterium]|jgi:hypothetical protein